MAAKKISPKAPRTQDPTRRGYARRQPTAPKAPQEQELPFVIVRAKDAGVHAGGLVNRDTQGYVVLRNARRIWFWSGAASLSELAVYGAANPKDCRFGAKIERQEIRLTDVCEIIHCQLEGQVMIERQPEWRAK